MTALTLRHVDKSFGKVEVLKDINLDIKQGELIAPHNPTD